MLEKWCSTENAGEVRNIAFNAEPSRRPCVLPPTLRSTFLDNRTYDSGFSTPRATSLERRIADIEDTRRRPSCREPFAFLSSVAPHRPQDFLEKSDTGDSRIASLWDPLVCSQWPSSSVCLFLSSSS